MNFRQTPALAWTGNCEMGSARGGCAYVYPEDIYSLALRQVEIFLKRGISTAFQQAMMWCIRYLTKSSTKVFHNSIGIPRFVIKISTTRKERVRIAIVLVRLGQRVRTRITAYSTRILYAISMPTIEKKLFDIKIADPKPSDDASSDALTVYRFWTDKTGTKVRSLKVESKILKRIQDRLAEGFTVEDLQRCVAVACHDKFYLTHGYYKQPDVFWRNAERVHSLVSKFETITNRQVPL
jgi:hypothetical protein